ncbi:MAG: hypothetical protein ACAH11_04555 [Sphingomonas sp.]
MALANEKPATTRNFAAWGGVAVIAYILIIWGGALVVNGEGLVGIFRALFRSTQLAVTLGLALILSVAVTGFSNRKRPVTLRTVRNYVIHNLVAIIALLLVIWGFTSLNGAGALGAMGGSTWAAFVTGATLIVLASLGTLALGSVHAGTDLVEDEAAAYDLRERGRLIFYSMVWMAACGTLLIVLGMGGPGGLLPANAALAAALGLSALLTVLGVVSWRLSDELARTLSRESGNMALYLILIFGGGWSILAHLGFVTGPAPLDWLTLFTVLLFAASFIVLGRRKLLTR